MDPVMDDLDLHLFLALRGNARIPLRHLAQEADMAESTVRDRLHRWQEQGIIQGWRAEIDPAAIGHEVTALLFLTCSEPTPHWPHVAGPGWIQKVWERADRSCDKVALVSAPSADGLDRLLEELRREHGLQTRRLVVLSSPHAPPREQGPGRDDGMRPNSPDSAVVQMMHKTIRRRRSAVLEA